MRPFNRQFSLRRVLVAPNAFKGTLTAVEAAEAIAAGIRRFRPSAEIILHPVSDGGEGLLALLAPAMGCTIETAVVSGPLPAQRVKARWGWCSGKAIIESAEAAGLLLIPEKDRNPLLTSTYGVGELIRAALEQGAKELIIGLGGSGTNDGGSGMAAALGVEFRDSTGKLLAPGGAALLDCCSIDTARLDPRLSQLAVRAACDVTNPLLGTHGATKTYGPQKGADPETIDRLEAALCNYASRLEKHLGRSVSTLPGSGAAGGLGAGLLAFCHASLESGIDLVLEGTGFDRQLEGADLVLTGEGRIDAQSGSGKAVDGVLRHSAARGVPVAALSGASTAGVEAEFGKRFLALGALASGRTTVEEAIGNAAQLLSQRTEELLLSICAQYEES